MYNILLYVYRDIVQLVERWSPKPNVEGSSPSVPVKKVIEEKAENLVRSRISAFFFSKKLYKEGKTKLLY